MRTGVPRGYVMTLGQCWQLAVAWYHDRLDPAWRRKTPEEAQATFEAIGLTGDFWRVA